MTVGMDEEIWDILYLIFAKKDEARDNTKQNC